MITEPARRGDGWRHGSLGDTGTGKTWAMREVVQVPGQFVLVHDEKGAQAEYPDLRYMASTAELCELHVDELDGDNDLHAVGFRGDPFAGVVCGLDPVAELALQMARARIPTRLVIDELEPAVTPGGQQLRSEAVRLCFVQGRAMGLSVAWGTQTPQRVPREVLDQSSSISLFRVGPRALNYLDERCFFDPEMLAVVERLRDGDFVLHRNGYRWDRAIYRF